MAGRRGGGGNNTKPADGELRQSQIVTTFGPGAMVDLLDAAVLVAGTDFWSMGLGGGVKIQEPRLRDRVVMALRRFREAGAEGGEEENVELSWDAPFRAPPASENRQDFAHAIKAFEFPRWHVCQRCRALVRSSQLEFNSSKQRYEHRCDNGDKGFATPVRFVVACRHGHLDEFPWVSFVHTNGICGAPRLILKEGASGDFADVEVRCETCGARRPLSQAKIDQALPFCRGTRPWFGPEANEECDEHQRLIVRTASNGYFPWVMSALTIPPQDNPWRERVEAVFDVLREVESVEALHQLRGILKAKLATLSDATDEEIFTAIQLLKGKAATGDEQLRTPEYERFLSERDETPGELPLDGDRFFARRAKPSRPLPKQIERIVLAPRLREVRALVGFTRLEASTQNLQGEYDLGVRPARVSWRKDWLPATEVHGEGVLLVLDEDAVQEWESRAAVKLRAHKLEAGFNQWRAGSQREAEFPGVRYYLLHTLSHMLIQAVSLECGYAASAIRERIYCSSPKESVPMAGILLHTGTPGSEGTLGGLVEEGRRFVDHLARAWERARLCSHDPVCGQHDPEHDQAERHLTGAACHGCLYIAESSCERFNQYLDRALAVPVMGQDSDLAFFREVPR
jgi:hypothetical protein